LSDQPIGRLVAAKDRNHLVKHWLLLILFVLIAFAASGYFLWTTMPIFALQEAAAAAQDHDLPKFQERVDLNGFVEALLDDLLVYPAKTTPGLSRLQREVAAGAVALAKTGMESELIRGIERGVGGTSRSPKAGYFFEEPAAAGELIASNDINELLKVTGRELSGSLGRLKEVVYKRMQTYAQSHRDTTPCRLLACLPNQRMAELKQILAEDGLTAQNFRGLASYGTADDGIGGETCRIGLKFFSPKVNRDVNVKVELTKGSAPSVWRVKRLSNIPDVFTQLGEDYDDEMHTLVASSLSGISDAAVNKEMHGATERITESQTAQNLLKRLNIKLK